MRFVMWSVALVLCGSSSGAGGEPFELVLQMDSKTVGPGLPVRGTLLVVNTSAEAAVLQPECTDDSSFEVTDCRGHARRFYALEVDIEGGRSRKVAPGEAYCFGFVLIRDQAKPPQFVFGRPGEYSIMASKGGRVSKPVSVQVHATSRATGSITHLLTKPDFLRIFYTGARHDEDIRHLHLLLKPDAATPLNDECHLAMARFFGRKATEHPGPHQRDDVWSQPVAKEWALKRAIDHYNAMSAESEFSEARRTFELAALVAKYGWGRQELPAGVNFKDLFRRLQANREVAEKIAFESFGSRTSPEQVIVYFSGFQVAEFDDLALDTVVPFQFDHSPSLVEVVAQIKATVSVRLDFPAELLGFSQYHNLKNGSIRIRDFMHGYVGSNPLKPMIWVRKGDSGSHYSLEPFDPRLPSKEEPK
jgi:hypothetical protein